MGWMPPPAGTYCVRAAPWWRLNPVETIWQSLRQNRLANRVFDSDDAIVDVCCDAWNALIAIPVAGAGPRGPPLSQVLTVWLSITAAVGLASRPHRSRSSITR